MINRYIQIICVRTEYSFSKRCPYIYSYTGLPKIYHKRALNSNRIIKNIVYYILCYSFNLDNFNYYFYNKCKKPNFIKSRMTQ